MNGLQIAGGILILITSILLIALTLLQESKQPGALGSLTGQQSDSYLSKNRGRTLEAKMVFITRILLIVFLVVTVVLNILIAYVK